MTVFTVRLARRDVVFDCPDDTTVLAAAKAAGIRLPFACAKGICGTCKSRLLAGQVDMKHGGGISPKETLEGFALLCCSRPLSDLEVDR